MDLHRLWNFLLPFHQRYPLLLPLLLLLPPLLLLGLRLLLLGGFRRSGYRHPDRRREHRLGLLHPPGWVTDLRPSLGRLLTTLLPPPLLLGFRRRLIALQGLLLWPLPFGYHPPLLALLLACSLGLALALLVAFYQEWQLALHLHHYIQWQWPSPRLRQLHSWQPVWWWDWVWNRLRSIRFRWWFRWYWRQSLLGAGRWLGRGTIYRAGRGMGVPPRPYKNWLGVRKGVRKLPPLYFQEHRFTWLRRRRRGYRWLRVLLGLVVSLLLLQAAALVELLRRLPATLFGRRRPPRLGSVAGVHWAREIERHQDRVRKANYLGLLLLGLLLLLARSLPYRPGQRW